MFHTPMRSFMFLPILFLLLGMGLLVGAGWSYSSTQTFLQNAIATNGQVIDYVSHRDDDNSVAYYPVVRFTVNGDSTIEFTANIGSSSRPYQIGGSVPVRYDPKDPTDARIDSLIDLWMLTGILGFIGTIFTAIGCGVWWMFLRNGRI